MSLSNQMLGANNSECSELVSVSKLLLNAWSAEYALRIKPLCVDREYLNQSLNWIYPQSYYAVFFSVRAVLAADGVRISSQDQIEKLLFRWAKLGHYGPVYTRPGNPFAELFDQRIKAQPEPVQLSGPEAATLHVRLLRRVIQINTVHETYIYNRLGQDAYQTILLSMPKYLTDSFVNKRSRLVARNML